MADNNQPIEWYLARDGQQHGPVTDAELKKIIELGYLRPADLVWRQGMPEWALAESVLDLSPPAPAPPPAPVASESTGPAAPARGPSTVDVNRRAGPQGRPDYEAVSAHRMDGRPGGEPASAAGQRQPSAAMAGGRQGHGAAAMQPQAQHVGAQRGPMPAPQGPQGGYQPHSGARGAAQPAPSRPERASPISATVPGDGDADAEPERSFPWRTVAALVILAGLAAGALALYKTGKLTDIPFLAAPVVSDSVPVVSRPGNAVRDAGSTAVAGPMVGSGTRQAIDESLQRSPLWRLLKRDFSDWYQDRIAEVAKLSSESKSEREISASMTRAIVDLRRRHHADALAAGPARLKSMAAAFVDNLSRLSRISTPACYGYISQGEASPAIADLQSPEERALIDAQLATIFDAVAEGRQSPTTRDPPKREDYDILSSELAKRGWSAADLQLFTDARALSRAAPEKVCQMVQDWFAAQLAVEDEPAKIRLLGEALKPVVAG